MSRINGRYRTYKVVDLPGVNPAPWSPVRFMPRIDRRRQFSARRSSPTVAAMNHASVPGGGSEGSVPTRVPGDVLVHLRRARDHLDQNFAEPIDLAAVAAIAGVSKFHFHRLFSATYGKSPASYLTERRIERAQDLLRATNLTVTEICFAVGYSSLGSFSARFKELVGDTPSAVQRQHAETGAPVVPGCFVFMRGLAQRRTPAAGIDSVRRSSHSASGEKPGIGSSF